MDTAKDQIFTSAPAAFKRLGIGTTKGWELVRQGVIPSARIGDRVLIPVRELNEWAASIVTRGEAA